MQLNIHTDSELLSPSSPSVPSLQFISLRSPQSVNSLCFHTDTGQAPVFALSLHGRRLVTVAGGHGGCRSQQNSAGSSNRCEPRGCGCKRRVQDQPWQTEYVVSRDSLADVKTTSPYTRPLNAPDCPPSSAAFSRSYQSFSWSLMRAWRALASSVAKAPPPLFFFCSSPVSDTMASDHRLPGFPLSPCVGALAAGLHLGPSHLQ
jgi:hypothetical protein